ncbi:MAG TPA: hypothetical protein VK524_14160, partial [Polyangiaceae bacterium]|nr:hypothetical protein [Polyangiaceae bacterium]
MKPKSKILSPERRLLPLLLVLGSLSVVVTCAAGSGGQSADTPVRQTPHIAPGSAAPLAPPAASSSAQDAAADTSEAAPAPVQPAGELSELARFFRALE